MTAPLLHMSLALVTLGLLLHEIENKQATSWLEHASNFSKTLTLEFLRQMVHHQTTEDHVERVVRKGKLLDHTDLEIDLQIVPGRFTASNCDHLRRSVNTIYLARFANTLPG